ncbi:MAG: hypothetical protein ABJ004_09750 [Cyclobacteriaceae bacterium]
MKATTVLLAILLCISLYGHSSSGNEYQVGILKLENKTIKAEIKINSAQDMIQVRQGNRVSLYRPRDIQKVIVNDKTYGGFSLRGEYYLFEILYDGEDKILYHEGLKYLQSDSEFLPPIFLFEGKEAVPIHRDKLILNVFDNDKLWMKQYIKNENLTLSDYSDLIQVFAYYKETTYSGW